MKKGTLSVAVDAALNAWALREKTDSTSAAIAAHAVAHGISASGLYKALLSAGLISRVREQRKA